MAGDTNATYMSKQLKKRLELMRGQNSPKPEPVAKAALTPKAKVPRAGQSAAAVAEAGVLAGTKRKQPSSNASARSTPRSTPTRGAAAAAAAAANEPEADAKVAPVVRLSKASFTPQRKAAEERLMSTVGARKRMRWTEEEEQNLNDGVRRHGVGAWAVILDSFHFNARTPSDLKDKWRNLVKASQKAARLSAAANAPEAEAEEEDAE
jgi:hypothetical protein